MKFLLGLVFISSQALAHTQVIYPHLHPHQHIEPISDIGISMLWLGLLFGAGLTSLFFFGITQYRKAK